MQNRIQYVLLLLIVLISGCFESQKSLIDCSNQQSLLTTQSAPVVFTGDVAELPGKNGDYPISKRSYAHYIFEENMDCTRSYTAEARLIRLNEDAGSSDAVYLKFYMYFSSQESKLYDIEKAGIAIEGVTHIQIPAWFVFSTTEKNPVLQFDVDKKNIEFLCKKVNIDESGNRCLIRYGWHMSLPEGKTVVNNAFRVDMAFMATTTHP